MLYLAWGQMTPAKQTALANLAASGLDIFVIVNRRASGDYEAYLPYARMVMDRPNWGYDFGGWRDGVQHFDLSGYDFIYFVNDSIIGPWAPVTEHLDAFEQSEAEIFGVTDNFGWMHHIQSYFFGLSAKIFHSATVQELWQSFKLINRVQHAIYFGELALSKLLWDFNWYIVAPRSELDEAYGVIWHKDAMSRFSDILGPNNKYLNNRVILRSTTTTAYYQQIVEDYHFPILKVRLLSTHPARLSEFDRLLQDYPHTSPST